jgi:hypothetical protein
MASCESERAFCGDAIKARLRKISREDRNLFRLRTKKKAPLTNVSPILLYAHSSEIESRPNAGPGDVPATGCAQKAIRTKLHDRGVDIKVWGSLPFDLRVDSLSEKPPIVCVARDDWYAGRLINQTLRSGPVVLRWVALGKFSV